MKTLRSILLIAALASACGNSGSTDGGGSQMAGARLYEAAGACRVIDERGADRERVGIVVQAIHQPPLVRALGRQALGQHR